VNSCLARMDLMHFFGCQGHLQFAGVDRQPFALVPAYGMGDNGRHNRWVSSSTQLCKTRNDCTVVWQTFQHLPGPPVSENNLYAAPTNSFARGMGLMGALEDTMEQKGSRVPVSSVWQYHPPVSAHWTNGTYGEGKTL